jgi:hypothetical protein
MRKEQQPVWVKCRLWPGAFPNECVFRVEVAGGGSLSGAAPLLYCYGPGHSRLTEGPPPEGMEGYVLGLKIAHPGGFVRVYMPDSEVYDVDARQVEPVEAERVPQW